MEMEENIIEDILLEDIQISCMICSRTYQTVSSLNRHLRDIHKSVTYTPNNIIKCSICGEYESYTLKSLITHLENVHSVIMQRIFLTFDTEEQFNCWKKSTEKKTSVIFVKKCGDKRRESVVLSYYYCHRHGYFQTKGKGKRSLKKQGSNKINSGCPAHIKVKTDCDGKIEVEFLNTHVGHTLDLKRVPLTTEEKQLIAEKLSNNIPVETILESARDSVGEQRERSHLLTRRDIQNIKNQFNITKADIITAEVNDEVDDLSAGGWEHDTFEIVEESLERSKADLREVLENIRTSIESCKTVEHCQVMFQLLTSLSTSWNEYCEQTSNVENSTLELLQETVVEAVNTIAKPEHCRSAVKLNQQNQNVVVKKLDQEVVNMLTSVLAAQADFGKCIKIKCD